MAMEKLLLYHTPSSNIMILPSNILLPAKNLNQIIQSQLSSYTPLFLETNITSMPIITFKVLPMEWSVDCPTRITMYNHSQTLHIAVVHNTVKKYISLVMHIPLSMLQSVSVH